jgi:phosphohistidine phosphatase SixA
MTQTYAAFVWLLLLTTSCSSQTYYIVRHADRVPNADALTPAGIIRSRVLADSLRNKRIQRIFSTNTQRTRQTAQPLSAAINVSITLYSADTLAGFVNFLKNQPNSLVVGHSNTILETARALGATPTATTIGEQEFDRLFIITRKRQWPKKKVRVSLVEARYGAVAH